MVRPSSLSILFPTDCQSQPCPHVHILTALPSQTIFTLFIFNSQGTCLFYSEFGGKLRNVKNQDHAEANWYGFQFSLRLFCKKLSPNPDQEGGLRYFKTSTYKMHFYESASGIKFILNTDPDCEDMHEALAEIYSDIFVEYVVKNPLYELGSKIDCELFVEHLNAYVANLE